MAPQPLQIHATTIAIDGRAVVLKGPSGSGKSALALQLMALGARLVADDITQLLEEAGTVIARCPAAIQGQIEARGVGLLRADPLEAAPVALVVDMGIIETDRLPPGRRTRLSGQDIPLLHKVESAHFPAAILYYMRGGRSA